MKKHIVTGRILFLIACSAVLFFSGCGRDSSSAALPASAADAASAGEDTLGAGHTFDDPESAADAAAGPDQAQPAAPAVQEQPTETPTPTPEPTPEPYEFTLGFAGDINFADNYIPMQHLAEIGSEEIADGIDQRFIDLMRGMDKMWINNEFVYSDRGAPLDGKAWTFCGSPSHVSYMHDLGVDIVGLANNHTYDYGEEAFLDTLTTLEEAGIPYVGAGRNLDAAKSPVYLEAGGFTIAYVAASNCEYTIYTPEATDTSPGILWCYDNTRFLESIREAAENADFVIALPHWGTEHSTELTWEQTEGAHAYIDAGADAVIGAHPHILQGLEYYNGKPILYSLGNFWFDDYDIDTMVAALHFSGTRPVNKEASLDDASLEVILYPGTQSGVFTAWADSEEWRERIFDHLEAISINVEIDENGILHPTDPA